MAGTNQFEPFATAVGANVLTNAQYLAAVNTLGTSLIQIGLEAGILPSQTLNTILRQGSFVATAIAQSIADQMGVAVNDDGVVANFEKQLLNLLQACPFSYAVDTGAANAYAIALTPAPVLTDGMMVAFKAGNASTGASTLNINSLGAKSLVNQDGTVLAANTITAGAYVVGIYSASANNIRLIQGLTQSLANGMYLQSGANGLGGNRKTIAGSYQILATDSGLIFDPWNATAGFVLTLPLTAGNIAPPGFNLIIGPNQNGGTILLPGTSLVNIYLPDGSAIAPGASFTMPLGVGHAFRIYEFASIFRLETIGRTIVSNAVNTNEAVALGQFPASLAANGYQKLANGLIMQWGADLIPLSTTSTLNYPIAFPTAVLQHIAGTKIDGPASGTRNDATGGAGFSLSQYQSRQGSASGSITISWIALGY